MIAILYLKLAVLKKLTAGCFISSDHHQVNLQEKLSVMYL